MAIKKVLETEELQTKVPAVTVALLVSLVIAGFFFGMNFSKMQSQDEIQRMQHQFALEEIQGLRNDMNREVLLLRKELEAK